MVFYKRSINHSVFTNRESLDISSRNYGTNQIGDTMTINKTKCSKCGVEPVLSQDDTGNALCYECFSKKANKMIKERKERETKQRAKLRGLNRGVGNKGRYSKKPNTQHKRKTKTTKKTNIMYTCKECSKSKYQKKGIRMGKQIQN